VHLVDIRRDPTDDDLQLLDDLAGRGIPTIVVMTKLDKLSRARGQQQVMELTARLGLDPEQVVPFSSLTREGREPLLEAIASLLGPEDEVE
jgi:GTP-binding protein